MIRRDFAAMAVLLAHRIDGHLAHHGLQASTPLRLRRKGSAIGTCSPPQAQAWARRAGSGLYSGQFTAERVKTRMAAAVMRIAQPARTSRLRAASVVVLAGPQMSCRPAPVWSSTP